jgi:hypothetical protein
MKNKENTVSYHYIQNPDVVLREEETEGGLLFNPDTNDVVVLNTTGLFIWNLCDGNRGIPNILEALRRDFDDVPEDQVDDHVQGFITHLINRGFLGLVDEQEAV